MSIFENNLIKLNANIKLVRKKKPRIAKKLLEQRKELYADLAKIIVLFPNGTPSNILSHCYDSPCFHGSYEAVIRSLNYKIDATNGLLKGLDEHSAYKTKTNAENWKFAIEKLNENRVGYENASILYKTFKMEHAGEIEILFSQEVLNEITRFDVFLNNAFGPPGLRIEEEEVQAIKNGFVSAMRTDIESF